MNTEQPKDLDGGYRLGCMKLSPPVTSRIAVTRQYAGLFHFLLQKPGNRSSNFSAPCFAGRPQGMLTALYVHTDDSVTWIEP